jgi:hypothetical protein
MHGVRCQISKSKRARNRHTNKCTIHWRKGTMEIRKLRRRRMQVLPTSTRIDDEVQIGPDCQAESLSTE